MNKKLLFGLGLVSLIGGVALAYSVYTGWIIHATGTVSMIKVYFEEGLINEAVSTDFGPVEPDTILTQYFWVKNYGSIGKLLTMTVSNWIPLDAVNYMQVTWDLEGQPILGNQILECEITLQVYENVSTSAIGDFSFDLTISGYEEA